MSKRHNNGSHNNGSRYENHQRAAELHEMAAHAHRTAAEMHEKQDHQTGQEISRQALEHSRQAFEHTGQMHRDGVNEHGIAALGHFEISELAYSLWQGRGCPEGSPDEDWLHAADQLRARSSSLSAAGRS
jgi:hypothetical protein